MVHSLECDITKSHMGGGVMPNIGNKSLKSTYQYFKYLLTVGRISISAAKCCLMQPFPTPGLSKTSGVIMFESGGHPTKGRSKPHRIELKSDLAAQVTSDTYRKHGKRLICGVIIATIEYLPTYLTVVYLVC